MAQDTMVTVIRQSETIKPTPSRGVQLLLNALVSNAEFRREFETSPMSAIHSWNLPLNAEEAERARRNAAALISLTNEVDEVAAAFFFYKSQEQS